VIGGSKEQTMQTERADDLIVARVYSYRHEAELGRSMLEAEGIEAMIAADDCGGQRPLLGANTGVKLLVRRSDEPQARKLLG
jgi:imidazoleglycerol phosphate synthase glutamine amidotransferase subunit HisH